MELRLRERQPLGLLDMEGSQAVTFAFGSLTLWCDCGHMVAFIFVSLLPMPANMGPECHLNM